MKIRDFPSCYPEPVQTRDLGKWNSSKHLCPSLQVHHPSCYIQCLGWGEGRYTGGMPMDHSLQTLFQEKKSDGFKSLPDYPPRLSLC